MRQLGEKPKVITAPRKALVVDERGCCSRSTKNLVVSAGRFQDENSRRDSAKMLLRNASGLFYLRLGRVSVSHKPSWSFVTCRLWEMCQLLKFSLAVAGSSCSCRALHTICSCLCQLNKLPFHLFCAISVSEASGSGREACSVCGSNYNLFRLTHTVCEDILIP